MPSLYSHLRATHCNNLLALLELELPSPLVKCPEINGSLQYEALREILEILRKKKKKRIISCFRGCYLLTNVLKKNVFIAIFMILTFR